MNIELNFATGDSNSRIHTVLVNGCLFGVSVTRKNPDSQKKCVWSVFDAEGILVDGGYGEEYDSLSVKEAIKEIMVETLKKGYGYE